MRELNIEEQEELNQDLAPTKAAKAMKQKAKSEGLKNLMSTWQYPLRANNTDVDQKKTQQSLRSSGLKALTEGFILAAKDQCLLTRNYQAKVIMNRADPRCRISTQYDETSDHLISGCATLARNKYLNRHNRVPQYLHWKICKHYGTQHTENWYENQPEAVTETDTVATLWDYSIQTERKIKASKPGINVSVAEFEKLSKYKDPEIEVERL